MAGCGLENEMATLGVARKQTDKARQTFHRSAQQAGFFWAGPDRLVTPKAGVVGETPRRDQDALGAGAVNKGPGQGNAGGGQGDGDDIDPLLMVLLKKMPPSADPWPLEKRAKWLRMVANALDMLYPDEDAMTELVISVRKFDSAK